jgi:hypothetical protein
MKTCRKILISYFAGKMKNEKNERNEIIGAIDLIAFFFLQS